jgi:hypothetical protein
MHDCCKAVHVYTMVRYIFISYLQILRGTVEQNILEAFIFVIITTVAVSRNVLFAPNSQASRFFVFIVFESSLWTLLHHCYYYVCPGCSGPLKCVHVGT